MGATADIYAIGIDLVGPAVPQGIGRDGIGEAMIGIAATLSPDTGIPG